MKAYEIYKNELIGGKHKTESEAARAALKRIPASLRDQLCELADQVKFTVRHYGNGQFYSWPNHDLLQGPSDPWPASRWPKAVLCMEFAKDLDL